MKFKEIDRSDFDYLKDMDAAQVVDVREEYEFEDENIGGINLPMAEILNRLDRLSQFKTILLCCRSGNRSKVVAYHLSQRCPGVEVYSLKGGINAYLENA